MAERANGILAGSAMSLHVQPGSLLASASRIGSRSSLLSLASDNGSQQGRLVVVAAFDRSRCTLLAPVGPQPRDGVEQLHKSDNGIGMHLSPGWADEEHNVIWRRCGSG